MGKLVEEYGGKVLDELAEKLLEYIRECFDTYQSYDGEYWKHRSEATTIIEGTSQDVPVYYNIRDSYVKEEITDEYYVVYTDEPAAIIMEFGIPYSGPEGSWRIVVSEEMRKWFKWKGIGLKPDTKEIKVPKRPHFRSSVQRLNEDFYNIMSQMVDITESIGK